MSEVGVCSRREADRLIQEGRVSVNGSTAVPGSRILPSDEIRIDGKSIRKEERKVLLLFYKPRGLVCSTKKQFHETTVIEYIRYPLRLFPVGRLDKDSEGLLLLTNQGDLADRILRARNRHEKEYLVWVDHPIDSFFVHKMSTGVPILDTVTRPCRVEKKDDNCFAITLTQGLNRQIRRMCEALGYRVVRLKRIRIMNLTLGKLKKGQYREVSEEEWDQLKRMLEEA